jgi:siroheme synthase (precorrin-2 oxidase/ferrochelatase)
MVRRGDISVAISTAGRSPALARKLRSILEASLPMEYGPVLEVASDVRGELVRRGVNVDGGAWQSCLDIDTLLDMAARGQLEEAREMLLGRLLASQAPPAKQAREQESQ